MTEFIQTPKVKIGGLWKNETKSGIVFYSGDLSFNSRIEIWPNSYKKEGARDPEFNLFIVEKAKKKAEPAQDIGGFPPNQLDNVPF